MKLVIKEYLSALKESGELDAILPDLLLSMGLKVLSIPQKGASQAGVDIVAVGKLPGDDIEKVYLLVVKEKDITRDEWAKQGKQDIRPSLIQVLDDYIPNRLSEEFKKLPIRITLCFGGEFEQSLDSSWRGFIQTNSSENITFTKWNGYTLAKWINEFLLNENIVNKKQRQYLRKTLALAEQPEEAFIFAKRLIEDICSDDVVTINHKVKALKTLHIVIRIIHSWARDANNLEISLLSSERASLIAWDTIKNNVLVRKQKYTKLFSAYLQIFSTWNYIATEYYEKISPAFSVQHSLCKYTGNMVENSIKVFDICGKVATLGIHNYMVYNFTQDEQILKKTRMLAENLAIFINNNPTSCYPIYDTQINDITLSLFFFSRLVEFHNFASTWVRCIINNSLWGYVQGNLYPGTSQSYSTLANIIIGYDNNKEKHTSASTLYPILAGWAAHLENSEAYNEIRTAQAELLKHTTFQIMFPDNNTEDYLFKEYPQDKPSDGATFSGIKLDDDMNRYLEKLIKAAKINYDFGKLSCIKNPAFTILAFLVSRHFGRPVIPQLWLATNELWDKE